MIRNDENARRRSNRDIEEGKDLLQYETQRIRRRYQMARRENQKEEKTLSIRKGKWTRYPTDTQIRKAANQEYWKFVCPICGLGCTGQGIGDRTAWLEAVTKADNDYPSVNYITCSCGWKWTDPEYYFPKKVT